MKTMKQTLMIVAASFATTITFAQVNLGITGSTQAAVSKAVAASAVSTAAQAATKAAIVTNSTTSATASKATDMKATAVTAAQSTANKGIEKSRQLKNDVKEATGIKAGITTETSLNTATNTNFNTGHTTSSETTTSASVKNNTGAGADGNTKHTIYKTEEATTVITTKPVEKKEAAVAKSNEIKSGTETKIKAKADGTVIKVKEPNVNSNVESGTEVKSAGTANTSLH